MTAFNQRFQFRSPMTLLFTALFMASTQLNAQGIDPITESIADSVIDPSPLEQQSVEQIEIPIEDTPHSLWEDYLAENNYYEGVNELQDKTFYLYSSSARVTGEFGPGWIGARNAAFETALLGARAKMAEAKATEIKADRSFEFFDQGADKAPRYLEAVDLQRQLSLVEKGERLLSAELDARLRRHYPDWDGTGVSAAERQRKVETAGTRLSNEITATAGEFINGAAVVFQTEGPDDRGDYIVLVGLVLSEHMELVARSMQDPEIQIPDARPGKPVREVLAMRQAQDPTFFARFNGTRVWRDEKGRRVLISAASHDRGSDDFITERKNALVARGRIARFIEERVDVDEGTPGTRSTRKYDDGTTANFNSERYEGRISGNAEERLRGTQVIKTWRGVHPISGSPMITTVMMWKPDSAKQISQFARGVSTPNERSRQGLVPPEGIRPRTLTGPAAEFDDF